MNTPSIHIHRPPRYFLGQVRARCARKWRTVTGKRKSMKSAMTGAILSMQENDKRARVLLCTTCGYYEPVVVMEAAK